MQIYRQIPNYLTLLRLLLAGVFFAVLNQYRYPGNQTGTAWLPIAAFIFVLAAVTDAFDGHLARRWHVESTFGRIMDPFCDKVLVIGAFIYLSGPRFVIAQAAERGDFLTMASGVYPWMVAVMLARELLVTGVRGQIEGTGVQFGANAFGKAKMILQSTAIPLILGVVWLDPLVPTHAWLASARDILVYATVLVTVLSGLPYVLNATSALRSHD